MCNWIIDVPFAIVILLDLAVIGLSLYKQEWVSAIYVSSALVFILVIWFLANYHWIREVWFKIGDEG